MITLPPISADLFDITSEGGLPVPLSSRFNQAAAEGFIWSGQERTALLAASNDPAVAGDPDQLAAFQTRHQEYTLAVAFSSAVVSHLTKGIETLVKS
jgi:hypothetical protein